MNYQDIGKRIRSRRKALGLSQERLAELVEISITHMSHIETGSTKLSLPVLIKLANALSCSTDELLSDSLMRCEPVLNQEIAALIKDCNSIELRILVDVLKATKASMNKNL